MAQYRAVSLFSGCGGFCEGVRLAGFAVDTAVEHDRYAAATYGHNFPEVRLFHGDVKHFMNLNSPVWLGERDRFAGIANTDLVFGGPPCQGFSSIGPRSADDPRNLLYKEFTRVLRELRPRVFFMENVPNMLSLADGRFATEAKTAMTEAGYTKTAVEVVSAHEFGVPQIRKRAIFFGIRDDLDIGMDVGEYLNKALESEHSQAPTVGEVLQDLPKLVSPDDGPLRYPALSRATEGGREYRADCGGRFYTEEYKRIALQGNHLRLYNHHTKGIRERRRSIIEQLKPGANGNSLDPNIWSGTRAEKWRRFHPDKQAHTILAQMHRDLSEWVHPKYDRWITVREAARLQSFHDAFVFKTSEWQMLKQIGNAVPPLMARALGAVASAALARIDR